MVHEPTKSLTLCAVPLNAMKHLGGMLNTGFLVMHDDTHTSRTSVTSKKTYTAYTFSTVDLCTYLDLGRGNLAGYSAGP